MFGIGMPEVAVILVVALIVLGPRRLPEMARTLGKGLAEFRKVTGDVNKELQGARDLIEREAREHERLARDQERESRLAKPPEAETGSTTPTGSTDAAPSDSALKPPKADPAGLPAASTGSSAATASDAPATDGSQSES